MSRKKRTNWVDEHIQEIKSMLESNDELTISLFVQKFPDYSTNSLQKKIRDLAYELGYNVDGVFSKDLDKPLCLVPFTDDGIRGEDETRNWTIEHDKIIENLIKNTESITIGEISKAVGGKATILVISRLKTLAKENGYSIIGLAKKVPEGLSRLDVEIQFKKNKSSKSNTDYEPPATKKSGLQRFIAYVEIKGVVSPILIKGVDIIDVTKKAERMGTVVKVVDAKQHIKSRQYGSRTGKELI